MKLSVPALFTRLAGAAVLPGAALSLVVLLSGCGAGSIPTNDVTTQAGMTGSVFGGQNPITGATIQIYSVGTGGYGVGATALGSSSTTNASGAFATGTISCPSASTLVYITATGGNPGLGTGTNANIQLLALLGQCGSLTASTPIAINEVTTVAGAFALAQYFDTSYGTISADGFGSPNTAQALVGMANAFTTAATLANTKTGGANSSLTTSGAGGALTVTPEATKLATIADILAGCVNSAGGAAGDGSNCGILFADAAASGVTINDTLQAAVQMNLNPTSGSTANLTAMFGIISSSPPYTGQAAVPTDWTLGIQYQGTTSTMYEPLALAIDAGGNVWLVNDAAASVAA